MCPIERFSSPLPGLMMLATDDQPAVFVRMYVNVVFYYYPPPATMAHTLHPLTPLFLSSTLLTVYMEMRLSLQKLLFADIPFVRSFVVGCCSMMNQRGGDDDMTQISESSQLFPWSSLYVLVSTAIAAAKKKHRVFPTFR